MSFFSLVLRAVGLPCWQVMSFPQTPLSSSFKVIKVRFSVSVWTFPQKWPCLLGKPTLCINGVPQLSWMVDTKKSHLEVMTAGTPISGTPCIIPSHPTSLTRPQPWFQRPLLFQRLEKGHGCEGLEGLKLPEDLSSLSLVMTSEWEWIKAFFFK